MMAAKPKLTPQQWLECRHRWEAGHRDGYQWLVDEMNLPVSGESVRQRAKKDGWKKASSLKSIVSRAHSKADAKLAGKLAGTSMVFEACSSTESAVDLRSDVIETHRSEWNEHREIFPLSSIAEELEQGRAAKISAEMLKIRQEGERKAWGLDALVQEDNSAISQDDLDEIYNAGMKRVEEVSRLAQKQYAELNAVDDGEAPD